MRIYITSLVLLSLLLAGCASAPQVGPATALLGNANHRIPIRSFHLESSEQPIEAKGKTNWVGGEQQVILFKGLARKVFATDIADYISSRFVIDRRANIDINLKLDQAFSYFVMNKNPADWIPYVGIVTATAEAFQKVPTTFVVEVGVRVESPAGAIDNDVFVREQSINTAADLGPKTTKQIYLGQIDAIRKTLFKRLDGQLLSLWSGDAFVGKVSHSRAYSTASFASELSKLDEALAERTISASEYANLTAALKLRYSVASTKN